jgi:hypothetical protein
MAKRSVISILGRVLCLMLAMSLATVTVAQSAPPSSMASTEQVAAEQAAPSIDGNAARSMLQLQLSRPELQAKLVDWGVTKEQAAARIAALSDAEAVRMAKQIDSAPAGGDVLGILFAIFIILLITDILGLTKVFPFTRSVR